MSDDAPFKRAEFLDKPGIVGARWWHEGLVHADPVGRRAALQALLIGGGLVALGMITVKASGCGTPDTKTVKQSALEAQKQYGWDFGARAESLVFDGVLLQAFQPALLAVLPAALMPARTDLRPYFIPTLLQSCVAVPTTTIDDPTPFAPLSTVLRPIFTQAMDLAFRRGKALASLWSSGVKGVAVVVDLPGAESVAFAAGAANVFDPVFAVDNWPHPRGVVPAHQTLAAAAYYQPLFAKAATSRDSTSPAMFVLDRSRLAAYADETNQFDNRHLARLPPAAKLKELGIRRILYVAPVASSDVELDDLNDDFVHDAAAGIVVKIVAAEAFGNQSSRTSTASATHAPDGLVLYYGSTPAANESFWADYPWLEPPLTGVYLSGLDPHGRNYVPHARMTPFSGGSPTGALGKTMPPSFGMVPVVVAITTGAVVGAELGRSGSWNRSSGGWGG